MNWSPSLASFAQSCCCEYKLSKNHLREPLKTSVFRGNFKMRRSKLRYYSDLELASTSKKIDKDEFFQGALNCHFTVNGTVITQTLELS